MTTTRNVIAAHIMGGLVANPEYLGEHFSAIARRAVHGADALIAELAKMPDVPEPPPAPANETVRLP